jgi:hypothetical protein
MPGIDDPSLSSRWEWNGHALVPVPPISTREGVVRLREMGIKVLWKGSETDLPEGGSDE